MSCACSGGIDSSASRLLLDTIRLRFDTVRVSPVAIRARYGLGCAAKGAPYETETSHDPFLLIFVGPNELCSVNTGESSRYAG